MLKAILKMAAGLTIIGPLNSPYGLVVQVTASLIWVGYCALKFYLETAKPRKTFDWIH